MLSSVVKIFQLQVLNEIQVVITVLKIDFNISRKKKIPRKCKLPEWSTTKATWANLPCVKEIEFKV